MTELTPGFVTALIITAGGISMILGLLLLRLTLTRRLKNKLKSNGTYWDSGAIDFGFTNTALFAWACTLPYVQRSERFQLIYGDLNVREFASRFEVVLAYATVGGLIVLILFGPLFYLFDA